jgi:hypothetical protein
MKVSYCDMEAVAIMRESLESRIRRRVDAKRSNVFLRADFASLGGYDQVGRALRQLTRQGVLVRIGFGLYGRATPSVLNGQPIPVQGLKTLHEALGRVGIETFPSQIEKDYNAGKTTQVPTGRVVAVERRVRRKIGYDGITLGFERARS